MFESTPTLCTQTTLLSRAVTGWVCARDVKVAPTMTPTRIAKHVFAEFIDLSSMLNSICWLLTISARTSRAIAGFLRPLGNQANRTGKPRVRLYPSDCQHLPSFRRLRPTLSYRLRSLHSCRAGPITARTISSTYFGYFGFISMPQKAHPITRVDLSLALFRQESTY
jgi:hypothetical protein